MKCRRSLPCVLVLAAAVTGLGLAAKPDASKSSKPLNVRPSHVSTDKSVKYDYDIVYVRGIRKGDKQFVHWPEVFNPLGMEPGADLMLLHPDGREELLVSGGDGSVTDPFVSFDGQWVYYAKFHNPKPLPKDFRGNDYAGSDIYKIHVKSRKIVQLTHGEFTPNTGVVPAGKRRPVFNLGPCPVPGGKVMFTSNRNGFLPTKEYTRTTLQLFLIDDDGGNVEEVGYLNVGSALHPTILRDGRIMFSSYESQGLRSLRNWGLWSIHPDGTNWGPLVGSFSSARVFHFQSQLSDGQIVVEEYYNGNNQGWGTYFAFPDRPSATGQPYFVGAEYGVNSPADGGMAFMPRGLLHFTAFSNPHDGPAKLSDPKNPKSPRVGKVTHPSGAPDNHLLTCWTGPLPGPSKEYNYAYSVPDSGIYLIKDGKAIDEPGQMLLIKNDPRYNEQWPRALVPYKRIYGIDEPPRLPFANDGKRSRHLPEGTPFGLVGTSSLYKRESYPGGKVEKGNVTAAFAGWKGDPYEGQGSLCHEPEFRHWNYQGAEDGRYGNDDVHAIRIVAFEPTSDWQRLLGGKRTFWNLVNERMRILGEFPVRKFKGEPGASATGGQPLDPDGNPDTSFLAKIPADVPFTFQMLDKDGMVLTMAQTWHQVRPGEIRNNCGGCHAHSQKPTDFNRTAAAKADYAVWDLTKRTPLLTAKSNDPSGKKWDAHDETGVRYVQGPLNVEYYRDVKPIFERSCVACHSGKTDKPAGNLVLDDDQRMKGPHSFDGTDNGPHQQVPGTFFHLVLDRDARFGPKPPFRSWGAVHGQLSRYVRLFQSRRSLLIWKIFGRRLDGWKNEDFAVEKVSGDATTLHYKGKPFKGDNRLIGLAYTGSSMPPPKAVRSGKVKPLTDEDRRTLVRWIDLGCPIDFTYDSAQAHKRGVGWMCDETRPTLTLISPHAGANPPLTRLLVGMSDYYSGLDMDSFRVVADFPINGVAAGENLAAKFKPKSPGVWELTLDKPISQLAKGKIDVSIRDRQGNVTRIERTFSVVSTR